MIFHEAPHKLKATLDDMKAAFGGERKISLCRELTKLNEDVFRTTLDGAVELRQVSFLWCKDLAAADTVATIPLYFFSLPINPLVLAMTALMVIQQHMTPMSMDPMQKKMMLLMPIVMLFMLYDLPSGLTLYWTVSNLFSIIQLKLQQRSRAKESQNTPAKN